MPLRGPYSRSSCCFSPAPGLGSGTVPVGALFLCCRVSACCVGCSRVDGRMGGGCIEGRRREWRKRRRREWRGEREGGGKEEGREWRK